MESLRLGLIGRIYVLNKMCLCLYGIVWLTYFHAQLLLDVCRNDFQEYIYNASTLVDSFSHETVLFGTRSSHIVKETSLTCSEAEASHWKILSTFRDGKTKS